MNRRRFFAQLWAATRLVGLAAAGLFALVRLRSRAVRAAVAPVGQQPLRPPGALPEDRFRAACTRCFLCGEVCPVACIRFPSRIDGAQPEERNPAGTRAGFVPPVWAGDDTPYVLPWERACVLCMACTAACPTGALAEIEAGATRMGVARIDRKICLPWTRRSWCGACFTICPYRERAITVDHQNRPTVNPEHCVGCGLCVEACPIKYKAIAVNPPFYPDRGEVRVE